MVTLSFRLIPYERTFASAVKACALDSWRYTYQNIFTAEEVDDYVNRFYSEENSLLAEDLILRKLVNYTLALDQHNRVIGFQTSSIQSLRPELMRIYVLPENIGMGVGSALLKDAENFFQANQFKSYLVKVHRKNVIAQKFYERHGFVFIGEDDAEHLLLKKHFP